MLKMIYSYILGLAIAHPRLTYVGPSALTANFFSYPELHPFLHGFPCRLENQVIDDDSEHTNPDAEQLLMGEGIATKEENEEDEKRQHVGQQHGFVASGGLQQQFHGLPHPIILVAGVLDGDDFLPMIGGDADALGMAAAARGAHDDLHADVVAIDGADDAFSADIGFFVHICSFVLVSPTLRSACVGLIALRSFCLSEAAQGIMF